MSVGYACLTLGVPDTEIKGCRLKNAGEERLTELIRHNLTSLKNIIAYNDANGIRLFRISSDLIPFGSGPIPPLPWADLFREELSAIGENIKKAGIRVSMHPGQYTVLNSPEKQVAERAAEDLRYHAAFLDSLGVGSAGKIVLHVGGVYGDKKAAVLRFSERYRGLDESIRHRLVIENDDKSYHIGDVLELGARLGIPVVYDNLHNQVNGCDPSKSDTDWISQCRPSWGERDGRQKVHYAQQAPGKSAGSHSGSIAIDEFLDFFAALGGNKPDIMLEVKDKNLSAVKCIRCTAQQEDIGMLELEWSRYKYAVLEKAPEDYQKIRELLKEKSACPALDFYHLIEHARAQEAVPGNAVNAALHVWGYFKSLATEGETKRFFNLMQDYEENGLSTGRIKRFLWGLTEQYRQEDLLRSYYFL